ncbi:MAG: thermonuclease family protein [Thermoguttaceae bacterium]|nr:thermonuclease family protein [Thermoguttaceae bacterium]MBQ9798486.1 thermonuclease family protein [Thermoguttaceae bacterium]
MRKSSLEQELAKNIVRAFFKGRGRQNGPKGLGGVFMLLAVVALFAFLQGRGVRFDADLPTSAPTADGLRAVPDVETGVVERCVDGDTLVVRFDDGTTERVRLIGANTPETVKPNSPVEPFGPEASAFTKRRVEEAGGAVRLVADGDRRDKYGRRLAFVYLADSEVSLNEELARSGFAKAQTQYRFSNEMKRRLEAAEDAARREKLGIHSL